MAAETRLTAIFEIPVLSSTYIHTKCVSLATGRWPARLGLPRPAMS
jgi:hypothetical protein